MNQMCEDNKKTLHCIQEEKAYYRKIVSAARRKIRKLEKIEKKFLRSIEKPEYFRIEE